MIGPNGSDFDRPSNSGITTVNKIIPVVLWIMVACGLVIVIGLKYANRTADNGEPDAVLIPNPSGAVMADVPWKHLPHVDRFELIDQTGNDFDSARLTGQPYLVSFFFASCPSICRDLNNQVSRLNDQLRKEDVTFVSITVDPENDTPDVLKRYAADYEAKPSRWAFLTDQEYKIKQLGEQVFRVVVDKDTHTDNILLVDKWGRYRDRFKWDDPYDMKRLIEVVKDVAAETEPPLEKIVKTRNVLAGKEPIDLNLVPWVREFHLKDQFGETFYSRDLTGQVWVANFFFTSCPTVCKEQIAYLRNLRQRLGEKSPTVVSITTDPMTDTQEVLRAFADKQNADADWKFCTGDQLLIERIGSEFFNTHTSDGHHSSKLFVVDRWGRVRGNFDWQNPADEIEMLRLIDALRAEEQPTWEREKDASVKNQSGIDL
jgi:cytochrome oxidase Cu insertion factor (SCO1/SenC/PrrC family)